MLREMHCHHMELFDVNQCILLIIQVSEFMGVIGMGHDYTRHTVNISM